MKDYKVDARMLTVAIVIASSFGLIGCGGSRTTPPGPDGCFSVIDEGAHFTFLKWKEGLAIMFVDRLNNHRTSGSSSTDDPVHRHRGSGQSDDGRRYDWELTTEDGRTASLKIHEKKYDLSEGTLFAIQLDSEQFTVHQLDHDISRLKNRIEDCRSFLRDNPDVLQRITP
jgi:hypothetical protein